MATSEATSLEQLEALRAAGKISQTDYETLRRAMEAKDAEEAARSRRDLRPPLTKSWSRCQLGGVCAGLAEHFDLNAGLVRLLFVLGFLFSGGAAVILYLVLYFSLPWNPADKALVERWGFPWGFAALLFVLWCMAVVFFGQIVPRFEAILHDMGENLPVLTQMAITIGHFSRTLAGLLALSLVPCLLFVLYYLLPPKRPGRQIVAWVTVAGYMIAIGAMALSLFISLHKMNQLIQGVASGVRDVRRTPSQPAKDVTRGAWYPPAVSLPPSPPLPLFAAKERLSAFPPPGAGGIRSGR